MNDANGAEPRRTPRTSAAGPIRALDAAQCGAADRTGDVHSRVSVEVGAQISVYDPAVTARNTATAVVKEFLLNTERQQHSQLRRMAQRLSLFTNLAKYVLEDPPRWRTHGGDFLYANGYNDALIFGDPDRAPCDHRIRQPGGPIPPETVSAGNLPTSVGGS